MQPIIYVRTEDKNEMLYTTKIIQNDLMEYQVLSSNYFNLGISETELKEFKAPIKNNFIVFGFIPDYDKIKYNKIDESQVYNKIEFDISKGKIVDNRFLINSEHGQAYFSFITGSSGSSGSSGNMSLYGPIITKY
jgi:hypothetical protein